MTKAEGMVNTKEEPRPRGGRKVKETTAKGAKTGGSEANQAKAERTRAEGDKTEGANAKGAKVDGAKAKRRPRMRWIMPRRKRLRG